MTSETTSSLRDPALYANRELGQLDFNFRVLAQAQDPAQMLVLAGVPIGEPVARGGPFVMNTDEEVRQAFEDYRAGRMGIIPG